MPNQNDSKFTVLYISSAHAAADFKNRCADISEQMQIATLKSFGTEPADASFDKIENLMGIGSLDLVIFHLASVNEIIGHEVFFEEIKNLIKNKATQAVRTAIVDEEGFYNATAKATIQTAGISIVEDARELGAPLESMLTPAQYELRLAGIENPAFDGLESIDYSEDGVRLPGMENTTPATLKRVSIDPFSELEDIVEAQADEDDPFADMFGDLPEGTVVSADPFADFDVSTAMTVDSGDPFANLGDVPNANGDPFANIDISLQGVEENVEPQANANMQPAMADINSFPVDATSQVDGFDTNDFSESDGDLFAFLESQANDAQSSVDIINQPDTTVPQGAQDNSQGQDNYQRTASAEQSIDVNEFVGGVGGVMGGTSVAEDVVDGVATPQIQLPDDFDPKDPFADLDVQSAKAATASNAEAANANDMSVHPEAQNDANAQSAYNAQDPSQVSAVMPQAQTTTPSQAQPAQAQTQDDSGIFDDLNIDEDDPFANIDIDAFSGESNDPFADLEIPQAGSSDPFGDEFNDDFDDEFDDEFDMMEDGGDSYDDQFYNDPTNGLVDASAIQRELDERMAENGGAGLSVEDLLDTFGHYLSDGEYNKMSTMIAPVWDYSLEHEDGIGKRNLLFNKKEKGSLSSADDGALADSAYIRDMEDANGYYSTPDEAKIIVSSSAKGGTGKRLVNSTRIIRIGKDGKPEETTIGEIREGDYVFNRLGKPVRVLECHPSPGLDDVYVVTLRDGRTIECCKDHLWNILTRGANRAKNHHRTILTTAQLMEKSIMKNEGSGKQEYRWKIPVACALEFPEAQLSQDPHALGYEIACGSLDLFIPSEYLIASIEQRISLLQGLMDAGGTAQSGRFSFTTNNEKLKDQFVELVRSLGYICAAKEDNRGGWSISIWSNDVDNIFASEEKRKEFYDYKSNQGKAKTLPVRKKAKSYDGAKDVAELPIHPYLFGLMTCRAIQGNRNTLRISCRDDYVTHRAISCLPVGMQIAPESENAECVSFLLQDVSFPKVPRTKTVLHENLRELDCVCAIPGGKGSRIHIPEEYLTASIESRQELLRGIMDGMGTFANSKGLPCVSFGKDRNFERELKRLITELGYSVFKGKAKNEKNKLIIETSDVSIFNSSLLREQMHNYVDTNYGTNAKTWKGNDNNYIAITNIEKTNRREDMTCLLVDDDEHLFVAGDYVVTHNTTCSVGIATQLNWYFNRSLMQRVSTNYTARVLTLSLNEFDDIPVHGIGYDSGFDLDNDTDGKNVAELLRRIDETDGAPEWDDISHCFVATEANKIFYLPSVTHREMLEQGISLTADDYRKIFECCKRFFQFIVVDTPDIFYHQKNDLMNFAYSVADVIVMVIEADEHSALHLYHFFDGLKANTNRIPLNPDKCMLVVNKFVGKGNPYITIPPDGQIPFENITKMLHDKFARFAAIPFTRPKGTGNILYSSDRMVKTAFAEIADDILEIIDENDAAEEAKKLAAQRRR